MVGRAAVVGELRHGARVAVGAWVDVRGEGRRQAATYRAEEAVALVEEVDPAGLHTFRLVSPARQARWLAAVCDPRGTATATGEPHAAASVDALCPHPDDLAARADTAARAWCSYAGEVATQRAVTVYGTGEGLWVVHADSGRDDGQAGGRVVCQQLAGEDFVALCAHLLDPGGGDQAGAGGKR